MTITNQTEDSLLFTVGNNSLYQSALKHFITTAYDDSNSIAGLATLKNIELLPIAGEGISNEITALISSTVENVARYEIDAKLLIAVILHYFIKNGTVLARYDREFVASVGEELINPDTPEDTYEYLFLDWADKNNNKIISKTFNATTCRSTVDFYEVFVNKNTISSVEIPDENLRTINEVNNFVVVIDELTIITATYYSIYPLTIE